MDDRSYDKDLLRKTLNNKVSYITYVLINPNSFGFIDHIRDIADRSMCHLIMYDIVPYDPLFDKYIVNTIGKHVEGQFQHKIETLLKDGDICNVDIIIIDNNENVNTMETFLTIANNDKFKDIKYLLNISQLRKEDLVILKKMFNKITNISKKMAFLEERIFNK